MSRKPITIKQGEEIVAPEILAQAIVDLGNAARAFESTRLNHRCLKVLLKDLTGVSMTDIERVLSGLKNLEAAYLKK